MTRAPKKRRLHHEATLSGLPGTSGAEVLAVCATSRTDAVEWLRRGRAITAAGGDGAINVWRDDGGEWRCEFQHRMITIHRGGYRYLAAVAEWLREWWPKMRR